MRALGKRGPGIFPKRFRPLLGREEDVGMWPSFVAWVGRASAADLTAAYEAGRNVHVRGLICRRVGDRGLREETPMLVHALRRPSAQERHAAADSLGKFGDPGAAPDFWARFEVEEDPRVREMLLMGLAATGGRRIVPTLIERLGDGAPCGPRAHSAWALRVLGTVEALPSLRNALADEPDGWTRGVIREAIEELERVNPQA